MATTQMLRQSHRMNVARGRYARRLAKALPAFFEAQAERVVTRWSAHSDPTTGGRGKAIADNMLPDDEDTLLWNLMISIETATALSVGNIAADMVGGSPFAGRTDPRLLELLSQSGRRVVGINDTTRRAIQQTIMDGYQAGYSDYQLAHGVAADGFRGLVDVVTETYTGRAQTISRTEIGTASNLAASDRYSVAGIQFAEIVDGPGCHLVTHDDGLLANGLILPLHSAQQYPLAHPNCRRSILPWSPSLGHTIPVNVPVPAIAGIR